MTGTTMASQAAGRHSIVDFINQMLRNGVRFASKLHCQDAYRLPNSPFFIVNTLKATCEA
jgi:hypothetical protein